MSQEEGLPILSSPGRVVHLERNRSLTILRFTDRYEVVNHYLNRERRSGRHALDWSRLRYDDPNIIDGWLKRNRLKHGVISGFRQWAYAALEWQNLLDCAVVDRISRGVTVRSLGALLQTGLLNDWEPITPNPLWHTPIRAGLPLPESEAMIMRPALPAELARFYVEDGSGRASYLTAHPPNAEVVAYAYVGFDPDPTSRWLRQTLDGGYFVRTASRYQRIEDILRPG